MTTKSTYGGRASTNDTMARLGPLAVQVVGPPDALTAALFAAEGFDLTDDPAADLVHLTVAGARAEAELATDRPLLVHPRLLINPAVAAALADRTAFTYCGLVSRHAAAVRSALDTVATGRLGLPWNVQADLILDRPTSEHALLASAVEPLDVVLRTVRLPVVSVLAREHQLPSGAGQATVHCTHAKGATSTIVIGVVLGRTGTSAGDPLGSGEIVQPMRHRYRISGSHGELLVDATEPAVTVRNAAGVHHRWSGPSAESAVVQAMALGLAAGQSGSSEDLSPLTEVLAAARESAESGQPVEVGGRA